MWTDLTPPNIQILKFHILMVILKKRNKGLFLFIGKKPNLGGAGGGEVGHGRFGKRPDFAVDLILPSLIKSNVSCGFIEKEFAPPTLT